MWQGNNSPKNIEFDLKLKSADGVHDVIIQLTEDAYWIAMAFPRGYTSLLLFGFLTLVLKISISGTVLNFCSK